MASQSRRHVVGVQDRRRCGILQAASAHHDTIHPAVQQWVDAEPSRTLEKHSDIGPKAIWHHPFALQKAARSTRAHLIGKIEADPHGAAATVPKPDQRGQKRVSSAKAASKTTRAAGIVWHLARRPSE